MSKIRRLSRRDFLKTGGVLVLGVSMAGCGRDTTPIPTRPVSVEPWSPDVYISFDADGTVNIISHRSEMGQGIRTGLPAVVADEMEADWKRVQVVQAPGDAIYGNQNTDGSWSVRGFMQRMREAGATARLMLEQAAAQEWGVDVAECQAQLHKVIHQSSGKSLGFADLVAIASTLPVPGLEMLTLKSPEQFRYIGKPLPIVDLYDMTHGRAQYGADIRIPGMKFAAIARPPVVFGRVKSYDAERALAQAGVEQVLEIPAAEPPAMFKALGGVAVIADTCCRSNGTKARMRILIRKPFGKACSRRSARPAMQSATRGMSTRRWLLPRTAWKRNITHHSWRMPRWSRRRQSLRCRMTSVKSGRHLRTRSP
jgi:isoquinoline 1-oxidoreductase beta subunit